MNKRKFLCAFIAMAIFSKATAPSHAATIHWTVSNVTTSFGGPNTGGTDINGFFDYNGGASSPDFSINLSRFTLSVGGYQLLDVLTPLNSQSYFSSGYSVQGGDFGIVSFYPNAALTNLPFTPGLGTFGPVTGLGLLSFGGSYGVPSVRWISHWSAFFVGGNAIPFSINGLYGSLQGQEVSAVPLPSSLSMFGAGLLGLFGYGRSHNRVKSSKRN